MRLAGHFWLLCAGWEACSYDQGKAFELCTALVSRTSVTSDYYDVSLSNQRQVHRWKLTC